MSELSVENFTANLKRLRSQHGLTQESLAERIDSTSATVNRWESGKHQPGYMEFFKLMRAFNVSFEELSGAPLQGDKIRSATPEEALSVLAGELGMEIKIVRPYGSKTTIPPKIISKLSHFSSTDKVWGLIEGVLNGLEKVNGGSKRKTQRA
jgi:transcriptional regulator with XRE-family HTH domain